MTSKTPPTGGFTPRVFAHYLKKYHRLLNKIMTDEDLTASEQFAFPYLEKLYSKKTSTSASNVVSISMHSILAWASVHPRQTEKFHDDTRFIWQKLEGETKANSKVIVKQDFEDICRNTEYKLCCHDLLVDTIVNVAFKPGDLNATKPHLGFSILAFLPRKPQEIVQLVEQGELMERASVITTADSLKIKLNAPAIPNTIDETLNALKRCRDFTSKYLGKKCPYAIANHNVLKALSEEYTEYASLGAMFGKKIGFEIFYQLTLMANRFYGKNTSKQSYKKGRLPSLDSSQLVNAIRMHQLTDLVTRP